MTRLSDHNHHTQFNDYKGEATINKHVPLEEQPSADNANKTKQVIAGTQGYELCIDHFIESSQRLNFHEVCKDFLAFLPARGSRILDVGSGAGQNAAALAEAGFFVTAVDPMEAFINTAMSTYQQHFISWKVGHLPHLECLQEEPAYDFILVDGVMHHLSPNEQNECIKRFEQLLSPNGLCAISLRHGPPGMGQHVHPTSAQQIIGYACQLGLNCVFRKESQPSIFKSKPKVSWDRLVLAK